MAAPHFTHFSSTPPATIEILHDEGGRRSSDDIAGSTLTIGRPSHCKFEQVFLGRRLHRVLQERAKPMPPRAKPVHCQGLQAGPTDGHPHHPLPESWRYPSPTKPGLEGSICWPLRHARTLVIGCLRRRGQPATSAAYDVAHPRRRHRDDNTAPNNRVRRGHRQRRGWAVRRRFRQRPTAGDTRR